VGHHQPARQSPTPLYKRKENVRKKDLRRAKKDKRRERENILNVKKLFGQGNGKKKKTTPRRLADSQNNNGGRLNYMGASQPGVCAGSWSRGRTPTE